MVTLVRVIRYRVSMRSGHSKLLSVLCHEASLEPIKL